MSGVEPLQWRVSRRCSTGACVEVARVGDHVHLRDAKDRTGPVLVFTTAQWRAFVDGVRDGDFQDLG